MPFRLDARAKVTLAGFVGGLFGALLLAWQPIFAAGFTPSQERIWKKSQSLRPNPSTDMTPVTIKMAKVTYHIPRNYLIFMDEEPTLQLTWPGLNPLTEETRKCFGSILQSERVGCTSIKFMLHGSGGPITTNAQVLKNFMRNSKIISKRFGHLGYTVYETGPKNARTETYTKPTDSSHIIFFHCFMSETDTPEHAVCTDLFRLNDGDWMHFFFRYPQIENVADIEAGMRALMESFRVKGGTPNDIDDSEPIDSRRDQ